MIGTVGSASPEQIRRGKDIDPRADIYSLGMVLFSSTRDATCSPASPKTHRVDAHDAARRQDHPIPFPEDTRNPPTDPAQRGRRTRPAVRQRHRDARRDAADPQRSSQARRATDAGRARLRGRRASARRVRRRRRSRPQRSSAEATSSSRRATRRSPIANSKRAVPALRAPADVAAREARVEARERRVYATASPRCPSDAWRRSPWKPTNSPRRTSLPPSKPRRHSMGDRRQRPHRQRAARWPARTSTWLKRKRAPTKSTSAWRQSRLRAARSRALRAPRGARGSCGSAARGPGRHRSRPRSKRAPRRLARRSTPHSSGRARRGRGRRPRGPGAAAVRDAGARGGRADGDRAIGAPGLARLVAPASSSPPRGARASALSRAAGAAARRAQPARRGDRGARGHGGIGGRDAARERGRRAHRGTPAAAPGGGAQPPPPNRRRAARSRHWRKRGAPCCRRRPGRRGAEADELREATTLAAAGERDVAAGEYAPSLPQLHSAAERLTRLADAIAGRDHERLAARPGRSPRPGERSAKSSARL